MPILVDGDNLLGTSRRERTTGERRKLVRELRALARRERKRIVTVFDGPDPGSPAFGADVHFSGPGRTADAVILETLRHERDRRGYLVVTSDKSLGDQCRWLGARVERCHVFRPRLRDAPGAEKPDREEDVDYWLEQFGETD